MRPKLLIACFCALSLYAAEPPLRILFLGNSFTYYNNLPGIVETMARAAGQEVEVHSVTRGGTTLEVLYRDSSALRTLRESRWDYVILQEQSTLGINLRNGDWNVNTPEAFHTWVRIWDTEIRASGAKTVLLAAWARRGRPEMQANLNWANWFIGTEINAPVIPAGLAFQYAGWQPELYADELHPSAAGSYLAACAAVEVLLGRGCSTAPDDVAGVPMDNASGRLMAERGTIIRIPAARAQTLREAALAAVKQWRSSSSLTIPKFEGETMELTSPSTSAGPEAWQGRWRGNTWLYGKRADVSLQLAVNGTSCSGTWTITAPEPATQTTLPLEECNWSPSRLSFQLRTLFLTRETHVAVIEQGNLRGESRIESVTPYLRQTGTWTLTR